MIVNIVGTQSKGDVDQPNVAQVMNKMLTLADKFERGIRDRSNY